MALEKLLDKLAIVDEEKGTIKISTEYDSKKMLDTYSDIKKLKETDIKTEQGIKDYKKITADSANHSYEEYALMQKGLVEQAANLLELYTYKNVSETVKEINEDGQINFGFQYCPTKETKEDDKKYNTTTKIILESKETMKKIQDNPEEFFNEQFEKSSPIIKYLMSKYQKEFLQIRQEEATRTGIASLRNYGTDKFIVSTTKYLDSTLEKLKTESSKIRKGIEGKIEAAEDKKGTTLEAEEKAKLISEDMKKLNEIQEKYADSQTIKSFSSGLMNSVIFGIKEKREKAKVIDINKHSRDKENENKELAEAA